MKSKLIFSVIALLLIFSCSKNKNPLSHNNNNDNEHPFVSPHTKQITYSEKDFFPKYSPNGQYIAFLSLRNTDDPQHASVLFELWAMNTLEQDPFDLLTVNEIYDQGAWLGYEYSWCADSYNLIIQLCNINEIWKISLMGEKTMISLKEELALSPTVSPDGSKIAYRSGNNRIIICRE